MLVFDLTVMTGKRWQEWSVYNGSDQDLACAQICIPVLQLMKFDVQVTWSSCLELRNLTDTDR